jgi:hypothetical protein
MSDVGQFRELLSRFTAAVESLDGPAFGTLFASEGTYDDAIYGMFTGPQGCARLIDEHFARDGADYRWDMLDPLWDGEAGYAHWLFSFRSRRPGLESKRAIMSGCCRIAWGSDGLITSYRDWSNGASALVGIGTPLAAIEPLLRKLDRVLRGSPLALRHLEF